VVIALAIAVVIAIVRHKNQEPLATPTTAPLPRPATPLETTDAATSEQDAATADQETTRPEQDATATEEDTSPPEQGAGVVDFRCCDLR